MTPKNQTAEEKQIVGNLSKRIYLTITELVIEAIRAGAKQEREKWEKKLSEELFLMKENEEIMFKTGLHDEMRKAQTLNAFRIRLERNLLQKKSAEEKNGEVKNG